LPWTKAASENRRNNSAGFSTEEALVTIRFDLASFAEKIYQWREALERRNFDNATPFTEWSPATFEEFELTWAGVGESRCLGQC
jgi:hypothetical protein